MDQIGFGVIGVGTIGVSHIRWLQSIPDVKVVAAADISKENLNRAKKLFNIPNTYSDYRDLLKDPQVDAVIVSTPPEFHEQQVIDAAEAGKHIFCEKPMAINLEECDNMIDAVKSAGVKFQIGFDSRFNIAYMKAKRMIENGEIGKPVMIRANRRSATIWWRPPEKMPDFWLWDWEKGGGPIIEQCIHEIDLSRWFFGSEAVRVYCELGSLVRKLKCGDNAGILIRYENGGIAIIDTSFSLPAGHPFDVRLEILGSEGRIDVDLLISNLTVKSMVSKFKERHPIPMLLGGGGPWLGSWEAECHLNELRHFVKCIRENKDPRVTGIDGKRALEIALAAVKSGLLKRPVELPLKE